jgi:hypothetical protein
MSDCSMDIHDALLDGVAPAGARAPGEQRPSLLKTPFVCQIVILRPSEM